MADVSVSWDGDAGPYVMLPTSYADSFVQHLTARQVRFRRIPNAITADEDDDVVDQLTSFVELRDDTALGIDDVKAQVGAWARTIEPNAQFFATSSTSVSLMLP